MNSKKFIKTLAFAFLGWALCGAIMGIGMATMTLEATLIVHAVGAPIIFVILSLIYFRYFNYYLPLTTALIFVGFVIFIDFSLVALIINKSLDMFYSFLGTWIPFVLIFSSTFVTGLLITKKNK
ncbi:hypothetical protein ACFL46_03215 [Candidatus Neomarinimicrobiota bacterium]